MGGAGLGPVWGMSWDGRSHEKSHVEPVAPMETRKEPELGGPPEPRNSGCSILHNALAYSPHDPNVLWVRQVKRVTQ